MDIDRIAGVATTAALHVVNLITFAASLVLAVSDNIGAAIIAAFASVLNTALILTLTRHQKETREDLKKRRMVVVRFGDEQDESTVVITPEERRAIETTRHPHNRQGE